jgi:hypothetical protein
MLGLLLVFVLLALGFDVLKLPATIAPDRTPWLLASGLAAMALLNLALVWPHARDDYLRGRYGLPRVSGTVVIVGLSFSLAMLIRGMFAGAYALDPWRAIDWRTVVTILIGGQFATLLFFAAYWLRRTEANAVRAFKKAAASIRPFAAAIRKSRLHESNYEAAYAPVKAQLEVIGSTAEELSLVVEPNEAAFARTYVEAAKTLATILKDAPTAGIEQTLGSLRAAHKDDLATLCEGRRRRNRNAVAL